MITLSPAPINSPLAGNVQLSWPWQQYFQQLQTVISLLETQVQTASGSAPATHTSAGTPGELAYDSGYIYWCIAPNSWLRAAGSTW